MDVFLLGSRCVPADSVDLVRQHVESRFVLNHMANVHCTTPAVLAFSRKNDNVNNHKEHLIQGFRSTEA